MDKERIKGMFFRAYLYITVIITGAVILILEILGTRIIAPYYGTTIYVWSSLIGITLLSLSAGYFAGGIIADRHPDPSVMYMALSAAALLFFMLPAASRFVLPLTVQLGPRFGSFASSVVLFALPLALLGIIAPFAVKTGAHNMGDIGGTAGNLYAASTIGSFAGAIISGFYLIPLLGINIVLEICGITMLAISGVWFLIRKKIKPVIAAAVIFSVFAQIKPTPPGGDLMNSNLRLVYEKESAYSKIRIIDEAGLYRYMFTNGAVMTYVDLKTGDYGHRYLDMFTHAFDFNPGAKEVLAIGLGGGALRHAIDKSVNILFLEIDPDVKKAAKDYFGFTGNAIIDDGRHFVSSTGARYDIIYLDVFNGYSIYPYLFSKEAFSEIKARLRPRGILAVNSVCGLSVDMHGRMAPDALAESIYATLKSVFNCVRAEADEAGLANIVFYASEEPLSGPARYIDVPMNGGGLVLTDNYNPVEALSAPVIEKWWEINLKRFGKGYQI